MLVEKNMDIQIKAAWITAIAVIIAALIGLIAKPEIFTFISFKIQGKERYSWADIQKAWSKISADMKKDKFNPDLIISIVGSGGMIANWLYKEKDRSIPLFTVLQESQDNRWREKPLGHTAFEGDRWIIHIPDYISDLVKDKNVLILDSGFATGETGKIVKNHIKSLTTKTVKFACLVYMKQVGPSSSEILDYYYLEPKTRNFWYPWGKAS